MANTMIPFVHSKKLAMNLLRKQTDRNNEIINDEKKNPSDSRPWQTFSPEATCDALVSTEQGLSQQEAQQRLSQYGFNKLTPAASCGPLKRFFSQFHNVLIYVLLAAAGVTAAIEHWVDSGVIVGVVVINALIGFIQEGKAEKALDAIRNMLTLQAMVRRDVTTRVF